MTTTTEQRTPCNNRRNVLFPTIGTCTYNSLFLPVLDCHHITNATNTTCIDKKTYITIIHMYTLIPINIIPKLNQSYPNLYPVLQTICLSPDCGGHWHLQLKTCIYSCLQDGFHTCSSSRRWLLDVYCGCMIITLSSQQRTCRCSISMCIVAYLCI